MDTQSLYSESEYLFRNLMNLLSNTKAENYNDFFISNPAQNLGPFTKLIISHHENIRTLTNGEILLRKVNRLDIERLIKGFITLKGTITFLVDNDSVIIEQITS